VNIVLRRTAIASFITALQRFLILAHPSHLLHVHHFLWRFRLHEFRDSATHISVLNLAVNARIEVAETFRTVELRKCLRTTDGIATVQLLRVCSKLPILSELDVALFNKLPLWLREEGAMRLKGIRRRRWALK